MLKKISSSIIEVYQTTKWVLSLYLKIAPRLTFFFFLLQGIVRTESIIYAYLFGLILDRIIETVNSGEAALSDFIPLALVLIIIRFVFAMAGAFSNNIARLISAKDGFALRVVLYERLRELGISNLEDSEVSNRSQRFSENIFTINNHLAILVRMFGNIVSLLMAFGVAISSTPVVIPIFLVAIAVSWVIDQKFIRKLWNLNTNSTEPRRRAWAASSSLSDPVSLKELITTGGYKHLHKKFEGFVSWYVGEIGKIRKNWLFMQVFGNLFEMFAYFIGLLFVFRKLLIGTISIGQLTFEVRSLGIFVDSLSSSALELVQLRESSIRLADAMGLFTNFTPARDGKIEIQKTTVPPQIEFENVNFAYPHSPRKVLRDLNLTIKPGEKIAIVGENGAGKTTLVKLLLRLYQSQSGAILIDKHNLADIRVRDWYKKVGVLFQDFNQYDYLTVAENVGIGDIKKKFDEDKIQKALRLSDAMDFIDQYPHKLNQVLSERYKEGIRPSTGQWQKIAIARFFYRDCPILILDEPTASIDAVAEAQIFDNIYKFIKNKTVIIISHRFSTVRNADRIIVLDKGQIVEQGSHEELLKNKGKYAHAFKLQARGYE